MRKTLAICLLCVDWQKHKNLFCKEAATRSSNIVAPKAKKSFVIHNPSRGVFVCKNVAKLLVSGEWLDTFFRLLKWLIVIRTRHYCQFLSERQAKPTITFQGPGRQLDRAGGPVWGGGHVTPKILAVREDKPFSNFSCIFLNPNNFFQFELWLFYFLRSEKSPGTS